MVIPFDAVVEFLSIQACSDLAIRFPGIGKRRYPVGRFIYFTDDFKALKTFQLSLHMRSHCYWALAWWVYDQFDISLEGDMIFACKAIKAIWKFPLEVGCTPN